MAIKGCNVCSDNTGNATGICTCYTDCLSRNIPTVNLDLGHAATGLMRIVDASIENDFCKDMQTDMLVLFRKHCEDRKLEFTWAGFSGWLEAKYFILLNEMRYLRSQLREHATIMADTAGLEL